ncbi:hypothetical protein PSH03_000231 [Micromonospora sp. PSH03]|uniref:hypothetical protein n=1 Tax=Micromonospora salmantinae TaxID=2911211 RepID=UPI001EE880B6|nr:hypothetical protein [Micromonospora salmantinae]MCG5454049.1 hypothetical protein [Micromonospora salmantinae]
MAEEPTETVEPAEAPAPPAADSASQRPPRRAKAAPAVLFQPPEPDRPLPRQPRRAPTELTAEAIAEQPEHAEQPTGDQPSPATGLASTPPKARTASVRRAAPRQAADTPAEVTPATPAPRKRAAQPTKAASSTEAASTTEPQTTTAASNTGEASTITPTAPARAAKTTKRAATPRKSTTPTKSTPPTKPAPEPVVGPQTARTEQLASAAPAARQVEPALGRTPESELRAVAARVLDHPGFAPELLALAAVRTFGPGAAGWAAGLRDRYPDASADGLARLAARRFVRSAGAGGATAALAGFFAPLAELAAVLWTHSELVLHLAAAYGKDPTHPDRAVDLLVLTQVHPDRASAAAALAAAESPGDPVEGAWPRAAEAAWRLAAPLTAQAGGWVALRLVARLLPGAAVLTAALGDAAAADRLAARTVAAYRPDRR